LVFAISFVLCVATNEVQYGDDNVAMVKPEIPRAFM
jgi:hypothetical protein